MATIYQRGETWYVAFSKNGRRVYRSLKTKSRRKAEAEKRLLERGLANPAATLPADDLAFDDLSILYFEWAASHRAPQTIESRRRALARLLQYVPKQSLSQVSTDDVERFKTRFKKTGVAPRTVNEALGALKATYNRAIRQRWYAGPNPFANVEFLPEHKKLPLWLSADEIETVLEYAELHGRNAHIIFALGIFSGMRKNEIVNAQAAWFDFDREVIQIRASASFNLKDKEERAIPFHKRLQEILRPYCTTPGYLIAPAKKPGAYRYRFDIRKTFQAVTAAAGLPKCTPHKLRHTFASRLAQEGVELYKIAKWMGHAYTSVTELYGHLRPQDDDINRI